MFEILKWMKGYGQMNSIKTWIYIAYGNLFAIFLNVFAIMKLSNLA